MDALPVRSGIGDGPRVLGQGEQPVLWRRRQLRLHLIEHRGTFQGNPVSARAADGCGEPAPIDAPGRPSTVLLSSHKALIEASNPFRLSVAAWM